MVNVFVDFETFYDEKAKYSLKNMATFEYIRDPRFKVLGMSFAVGSDEVKWIESDKCQDVFNTLKKMKDVCFVGHNASFDAAVAKEAYDYEAPRYMCTMYMARYLISQGLLPHDTGVALKDIAPFVDNEKLHLDEALEEGTLDTYAIRDTVICRDFFYKYIDKIPQMEKDIINTHVNMSAIPKFKLDESLLEKCIEADEKRQACYPTVRKDDLFIKAMRRLGEEVQFKTTAKGNKKPALSKTDDYMKSLLVHPNPKVKALAELRLEAKSTCERSKAARFLSIGSPIACPVIFYGAHCLTGDAEVLTPEGWVRLDKWEGGLIMQVNKDKTADFLPATKFVGKPTNDWVECTHPYMKGLFTEGHKIAVLKRDGTIEEETVSKVKTKVYRKVCSACMYTGEGAMTPEMIRVLVMAQADGHFEKNSSYGRGFSLFVRKERKKERARKLLSEAGIKYRELTFKSHPGYTRFCVSYKDYPKWFTEDKKIFGSWLLNTTEEARKAFCEELWFWDGYINKYQKEYYSTEMKNAEWASIMLSLCGYSVVMSKRIIEKENHSPVYRVRVRKNDYFCLQNRPWVNSEKTITPYCAETKTGFFLVRYNGNIFVTGNTGRSAGAEKMNVQNMPRGSKIRTALRAPDGYKLLIIDSSQVEVRVLAWLAGEERLLNVFRSGEDIYKHFGANDLFHKPIEEITKEERQISKPPVLAAGFGQSGPGLAAYAKRMGVDLSLEMAEKCVRAYREGYPAITGGLFMSRDGYWKRAEQFVTEHGYSVLPSGRRLTYPNLRWEQGKLVFDKHRIFLRDSSTARLWHGSITENCLADDTYVLIRRKGIVPMKTVKNGDYVFDGESYVRCNGYVSKGEQKVISKWGFTMTPDHRVLCGETYKEFKDVEYEAARRTAKEIIGNSKRRLYVISLLRSFTSSLESTCKKGSVLDSKMYKVRGGKTRTGILFPRGRNNPLQEMFQKKGKEKRRQVSCCMAKYDSKVQQQKPQGLQKLWGQGYICLRGVAGLFKLFQRCISFIQERVGNGQNRQQQRLFSRKCKVCDKETKYKQQKKLTADTGRRGMDNCQPVHGEAWAKKEYNILSRVKGELNKQKVGDLLNCGPNHRFMAISKAGVPFIVHNCVQAAARDLVFWQVEEIKKRTPYAKVALMVHDEAVFVVPEDKAEEALKIADECFRTSPPFMEGIPCKGEGHISDCYDK